MKGNAKVGVWIALGVLILCCGGGGFFAFTSFRDASGRIVGARIWMNNALTDMSQDWSEPRAAKYFEMGGLAVSGGAQTLSEYRSRYGKFVQLGSTFEMKPGEVNGRRILALGLRGKFERDDAQIRVELVMLGEAFQIARMQITSEPQK